MLTKVSKRNHIKILSNGSSTLLKEISCTLNTLDSVLTHFTLGQLCYLTLSHLVCNVTPVVHKQELEATCQSIKNIPHTTDCVKHSFQQTKADLAYFGPCGVKRRWVREGEVMGGRVHVCSWMSPLSNDSGKTGLTVEWEAFFSLRGKEKVASSKINYLLCTSCKRTDLNTIKWNVNKILNCYEVLRLTLPLKLNPWNWMPLCLRF